MPQFAANYNLVEQKSNLHSPQPVLLRLEDQDRSQPSWVLRVERRQGLLVGQRYSSDASDPSLMRKTCDYNSIALQMLFSQVLEPENYRITGISVE